MRLNLLYLGIIFGVFFAFSPAFGQIQDLSCPSCISILPENIELYKELFPLIIWTDDSTYDHASAVKLSGHLRPENTFHPVTVTITDPIGNIVTIKQIIPDESGDFAATFDTSSKLWSKDGTYIIKAQSGAETRVFKTKVELIESKGETGPCHFNELVVSANGGTYCIPYEINGGRTTNVEGTLDIKQKTLSLNIRGTDIESIILDLPRNILDAKNPDGTDSDFVVLSKGKPVDYEKLSSDDASRKIQLTYPPDRKGQFEIVGTSVIPEFGTIAMMILLVTVSSVIVLSRSKLRSLRSV